MQAKTFIQSDAPDNAPFDEAEITALRDLSRGAFRVDAPDLAALRWLPETVNQDSAAAFLHHFGVLAFSYATREYLFTPLGIERAQVTAAQVRRA